MKLHLKRNAKPSLADQDKNKAHKIHQRLTRVSETVRRTQIAKEVAKAKTPAKPRADVEPPAAPKPANLVKIKLTRKVPVAAPAGNLTLNSGDEGAGSPAVASDEVVWKGRKMHGRHLPVLQCNNCSISRVCTKFKAGYECAFLPFLHSHKVESAHDLIKYMKLMTGNAMKRAQLMSIIETANGGMPSVETSEALDMAFRQLKELHQVMTEKTEEDSVEIEGDATVIGSIFGGMKLTRIIEETAQMKKADPVLALPDVPLAQDDVRSVSSPDVSDELIRDALLGSSGAPSSKKNLQSSALSTISETEISKS